ncbi:hypothetical protein ABKV19_001035 [Rosa sericea]
MYHLYIKYCIDCGVSLGSVDRDEDHGFKSSVDISVHKKLGMMRSTLIRDIKRFEFNLKIRGRVTRIWRPKKYDGERNDGLHCVVVDEKDDPIHGIIEENELPHLKEKIEEGFVYDIFPFHTKEHPSRYKVVDHEAVAYFNQKTKFIRLENIFPPIPRHSFLLLEFDELKAAMEKQEVLIDVYGCLKSVVPLYQTPVRNKEKMESKCEITLENLKREDLRITLWGDVARRFDLEAIQKHSAPVLVVFTSFRIALFLERISPSTTNHSCVIIDPDIPQREEYIKEFSKPGDKLKVIPNQSRQPTEQEAQKQTRKSVAELNALNPKLYMNETIFSPATIVRFSTHNHNTWWYKGCPTCYKYLKHKEDTDQFTCTEHDIQVPLPCYKLYMTIEDRENQATVLLLRKQAEQIFSITCPELVNKTVFPSEEAFPVEITNAIGQSYLFSMKVKGNGELIVRGVYPAPEDYVPSTTDLPITAPSTDLPITATSTDLPITATSTYVPSNRKRAAQTSARTLSKKIKREVEDGATVSSSTAK